MTFGDQRQPADLTIDLSTEPCAKCSVPTIAESAWKKMSLSGRKASGAKRRISGMCSSCYRGAEPILEPEPGADFVEPQCEDCKAYMVSRRQWDKADQSEREELREEGYKVVGNEESGLCRQCLSKANKEVAA